VILDCESYQSTLQSLFGIADTKELTTLLTGLDLVKIYEEREAADIWTEDALISTVESHLHTSRLSVRIA
jgi:hypothetical protein